MARTSPLNHRFMIAVREIEQDLRRRWSRPGQFSFTEAAYQQVGDGSLKAAQAELLETAWKVRGLLAHSAIGGQDPVEAAGPLVREVERIRNDLTGRVPTVQGFAREVVTATPATSVSEAAALMARDDFTCLPIYEGDAFVGSIDSDAVLSWLVRGFENDDFVLDATVADVRAHGSEPAVAFHRPDAPQRDVLATFEYALQEQVPLSAVLLTSDGTRGGKLQGILTPWDAPTLSR
jgi:CBS domain-containing protein